jgi:hypothetical protein
MENINNLSNRFDKPSDNIDMEKLEHETQKLLLLGLLVAAAFHAALGSYYIFKKTEVKVVKPPTMELVIRRPRMTKPFEFKKQRIQQREYKKKEIVTRKPTADIKTKNIQMNTIGSVTSYDLTTNMGINATSNFFIPEGININVIATREPEKQISMKEEMISIDDLDTGQFKAMVIQDPNNKQSIKGFIYIATLWGAQFEPAYKRSVVNLSDAVNRYTSIKSKVDKHLFMDSRKLFDTPFVFICVDKLCELTEIEARNFGGYLRAGGFALLDNGTPSNEFGASEASLRKMLRDSLGNDAKFLPIPNNHAIYHCFFDFDGPPQGAEIGTSLVGLESPDHNERQASGRVRLNERVIYLEGISISDRLVAIYSDKGYSIRWADDYNNDPQLKMGVNMVVFALTQDGSIAQQKMDFFSSVQ